MNISTTFLNALKHTSSGVEGQRSPEILLGQIYKVSLEEKGFLAHYTFGNTYQYYPVVSEEDFRKGTLRNVISKYFNNSYLSAVSSLVKEEDISLDDLKRLINEVEQAHQK